MDSFDKSVSLVLIFVLLFFVVSIVGGIKCSKSANEESMIENGRKAALIQTCLQQGHAPLDCTNAIKMNGANY